MVFKRNLRRLICIGCELIVFGMSVSAFAATGNRDLSLRINQNFNGTWNKTLSVHAWMFEHMNRSMAHFEYYETGIGPRIQFPLPWLAISFFYRQAFSKSDDARWQLEKAPSANIEFRVKARRAVFWNQVRVEYRFRDDWQNVRVKNFLQLSISGPAATPYAAWESFYENRTGSFALQRFFAGISAPLDAHLSTALYVRLDVNTEHSVELYRICVGAKLIFNFALHPE